jgi:hypothetical protein
MKNNRVSLSDALWKDGYIYVSEDVGRRYPCVLNMVNVQNTISRLNNNHLAKLVFLALYASSLNMIILCTGMSHSHTLHATHNNTVELPLVRTTRGGGGGGGSLLGPN